MLQPPKSGTRLASDATHHDDSRKKISPERWLSHYAKKKKKKYSPRAKNIPKSLHANLSHAKTTTECFQHGWECFLFVCLFLMPRNTSWKTTEKCFLYLSYRKNDFLYSARTRVQRKHSRACKNHSGLLFCFFLAWVYWCVRVIYSFIFLEAFKENTVNN